MQTRIDARLVSEPCAADGRALVWPDCERCGAPNPLSQAHYSRNTDHQPAARPVLYTCRQCAHRWLGPPPYVTP
jgi:hypothetical protein